MQKELVQILIEMAEVGHDTVVGYEHLLIWNKLFSGLSLLLGSYTTYALFVRSLELNRKKFTWLPHTDDLTNGNDIFADFEEAFLAQSSDVDSITRTLLGSYIDLLYSIIGSTMTIHIICRIASGRAPRK